LNTSDGSLNLANQARRSGLQYKATRTNPAKSDQGGFMHRFSIALLSVAALVAPAQAAELSKGFRLLIEHGFQVQGLATKDDVFHLPTYLAANYTTLDWLGESNPAVHGKPPGLPWGRWASDPEHMPPVGDEKLFMENLISVSLGDEPDLNNPNQRQKHIDWYHKFRGRFPRTILYTNNWGMQIEGRAYQDFITRAQPDMISFDSYPWQSDYATKQPMAYKGREDGNPREFYNSLKFVRAYAYANNIPFQSYRQSFHAVEDYSKTIYRDPSPSEFRLNTFAALAFGAKSIADFTYNTGATSYFKRPGGDTNKQPLYNDLVEVNQRVRNLGKALVRLKPVPESPKSDGKPTGDSRITSILFICGQHVEQHGPAFNALPTDFHVDAQAPRDKTHADRGGYSDWEVGRNDPYLSGWNVKPVGANGTPTKNNGLPGDVIISWFKLLDESFDGSDFHDEVYFMVTNGLTALDGTPADCRQQIQLDFGSSKSPCSHPTLERLNPGIGKVEAIPLTAVDGKKRLILNIEGGSCELFKFSTGAPFVGVGTTSKSAEQ
jgi:hypothetical protein